MVMARDDFHQPRTIRLFRAHPGPAGGYRTARPDLDRPSALGNCERRSIPFSQPTPGHIRLRQTPYPPRALTAMARSFLTEISRPHRLRFRIQSGLTRKVWSRCRWRASGFRVCSFARFQVSQFSGFTVSLFPGFPAFGISGIRDSGVSPFLSELELLPIGLVFPVS